MEKTKSENQIWNPTEEVNKLLNSIDDNETDLDKMAVVVYKSLKIMSLNDAYEFMTNRNLPVNEQNMNKFLEVFVEAFFERLEIIKNS